MMHNGNHQQDVVLEQKALPVHSISIVEQIVTSELKNTFIGTVLKKQKHITVKLLKLDTAYVKSSNKMGI